MNLTRSETILLLIGVVSLVAGALGGGTVARWALSALILGVAAYILYGATCIAVYYVRHKLTIRRRKKEMR